MKKIWQGVLFVFLSSLSPKPTPQPLLKKPDIPQTHNLFIITTDGFRWQELFTGADSLLINSDRYTPDKETVQALYWSPDPAERRKKLMPFFWQVIARKGQVFGNRLLGNKVNTANPYAKSYPGYNEIFTGFADPQIATNGKYDNPNTNVLEWLNRYPAFHDQVVAFTSWDVFPHILHEQRSGIRINSGWDHIDKPLNQEEVSLNIVQRGMASDAHDTRMDELTFVAAKEYIRHHKPRVVFLSLGETDEFAHQGRYDLYLHQANKLDGMLAELWHWVQTTDGYSGKSTFLITTDHGRGSKTGKWTSHGEWIGGSSSAWFAIMGPGISPAGEIREPQQHYLEQLASTISALVGVDFQQGVAAPPVAIARKDEYR